jgi:hypothetical protein
LLFFKRINIFIVLAVAVALFVLALVLPAVADDTTEPCVPKDAWTETIEHPAVTETVHHAAVPSLWWNWSPNDQQGSFDGPPAFPVDPRGTWQGPHSEGGPSQNLFGTFPQGNGHGSWFHREPGVAAYDEIRVIREAWIETIEHPAVVCETTPPTPTETPVVSEVPAEEPVAPVEEDDPVVETETHYQPDKTVKEHTHKSGKVTREVIHYDPDRNEEGL